MRRRRGRCERYAEARGGREQASEVSGARRERQQRRGEKASDERAEQHRAEGEQRKAFPRFCLGSSFLAWSSWKVARSRGSFSSQIAGPAPVPPPAATIAATTTAPPRRSRGALSATPFSGRRSLCGASSTATTPTPPPPDDRFRPRSWRGPEICRRRNTTMPASSPPIHGRVAAGIVGREGAQGLLHRHRRHHDRRHQDTHTGMCTASFILLAHGTHAAIVPCCRRAVVAP